MDNSEDYQGLLKLSVPTSRAMQKFAKDPVVQGLVNAVTENPIVSYTGRSLDNYIRTKSPIEIANDAVSVGATATAFTNPLTAPIGLARYVTPRIYSGIRQLGKELLENEVANLMASEAVNAGLIAEDAHNIRRALRR